MYKTPSIHSLCILCMIGETNAHRVVPLGEGGKSLFRPPAPPQPQVYEFFFFYPFLTDHIDIHAVKPALFP